MMCDDVIGIRDRKAEPRDMIGVTMKKNYWRYAVLRGSMIILGRCDPGGMEYCDNYISDGDSSELIAPPGGGGKRCG